MFWVWFTDNSIVILLISGLVSFLLLAFNDKVKAGIAKIEPNSWHEKAFGSIPRVFWTIEAIAVLIMLDAFVAIVLSREGLLAVITVEDVQTWFLEHGLSIIIILIVGAVLWIVAKQTIPPLVSRVMAQPRKGESREGLKRRSTTLQGVFLGLARILIAIIIIFLVLSEMSVEIGPILAGLGIVGIAVGFGAQYLVKDLIAGIFVLIENQYRVGDVAKVAEVIGLVEEINLRKTVLRDLDGIVHHVPNGEIRVASNYSRHFARVNLNISVSYGTDLDFAIGVINRVCAKMAEEPEWNTSFRSVPQVLRVDGLGDSGIDIKIIGDVKPLEQWRVMGELRLRLKREFDREGIEIPWPHTKVYFGNAPGDEQPAAPAKPKNKRIKSQPDDDLAPDDEVARMGDD